MGIDSIICEHRVGRLLEVQSFGQPGAAALAALEQAMAKIETAVSGQWVTVVDVRQMGLISDATARGLIQLMVRYNQRTDRAAYLLGGQSLFAVQLEAMVLQAHNAERHVFRERGELLAWLSEVCTPEEHERLAAFLES